MKDVDLKKLGTLRLCGSGALVALATWGVWAFCGGGFSASNGWDSAFDGWEYGREDQKAASAALAAAGLDEWSWDDGRLLVPKNKKNEYQTALAEAGAYPKAPSESRRDAIREMGAFESETKIRMRELDACAFQLERTLERIDGIEYATVGVRARREQAGLTGKTVVTASIGVACREGCELDANLLSAITVAAKHQLGVDANENLSILDLKAGKSYFGSEKLVGNGNELALATEKERVESYWRDKLLKTFDYMGGVRVSVAAELQAVDGESGVRTETGDAFNDWNELNDWNGASAENRDDAAATGNVASSRRAPSAAERLAKVEIGGIGKIEEAGKPRPLAIWSGDVQTNARQTAFARLGNPVATRSAAPVEAQNLAQVERKTAGNGVLAVGALERRDAPKRGVVPAGYRQDAENGEDGGDEPKVGNARDEQNAQNVQNAQTAEEGTIKGNETNAHFETVAQSEKKKETKGKKETSENKGDGNGRAKRVEKEERVRFRVRALAVRIGAPRGYVRRVAQNLKAENAVETFASDETPENWSALYRTTEQKIVAETKNVALLLLRPLAERNGWSEDELTRSVSVDVFTDPNDFAERFGDEGRGVENSPNGSFERVANFGRVADTSELVAEETTTGDASKSTTESEESASETAAPEGETSEEEAETGGWALWKNRALQLDAKTKAGGAVGLGALAALTLAAVAAARRRKKTDAERAETEEEGEEKESKKKANDAKRTVGRNKEKKRNKKEKRDASDRRDGRDARLAEDGEDADAAKKAKERQERENKTSERNLRVARIGGRAAFAQNAASEANDEETRKERKETETRNAPTSLTAQPPQTRRSVSAAQTDFGAKAESGRQETERFNGWNGLGKDGGSGAVGDLKDFGVSSGFSGFNGLRGFDGAGGSSVSSGFGGSGGFDELDDLDDWDELDDDLLEIRSLIERERARVGDETASTANEPNDGGAAKTGGDATRRRAALDLVARNPERAAASLQRWLRPGA